MITETLAEILTDLEVGKYDKNGTKGNIFVENLIESNNEYIIGIFTYGGNPREMLYFGDTRHYSIQINVKHKNKFNALKKITDIVDLINYKEFKKNNIYLHDIYANQEPFMLKLDKDNKYISAVNFTISCTFIK